MGQRSPCAPGLIAAAWGLGQRLRQSLLRKEPQHLHPLQGTSRGASLENRGLRRRVCPGWALAPLTRSSELTAGRISSLEVGKRVARAIHTYWISGGRWWKTVPVLIWPISPLVQVQARSVLCLWRGQDFGSRPKSSTDVSHATSLKHPVMSAQSVYCLSFRVRLLVHACAGLHQWPPGRTIHRSPGTHRTHPASPLFMLPLRCAPSPWPAVLRPCERRAPASVRGPHRAVP